MERVTPIIDRISMASVVRKSVSHHSRESPCHRTEARWVNWGAGVMETDGAMVVDVDTWLPELNGVSQCIYSANPEIYFLHCVLYFVSDHLLSSHLILRRITHPIFRIFWSHLLWPTLCGSTLLCGYSHPVSIISSDHHPMLLGPEPFVVTNSICIPQVLVIVLFLDCVYFRGSTKTRPEVVWTWLVQNGSFNYLLECSSDTLVFGTWNMELQMAHLLAVSGFWYLQNSASCSEIIVIIGRKTGFLGCQLLQFKYIENRRRPKDAPRWAEYFTYQTLNSLMNIWGLRVMVRLTDRRILML